MTDLAVLLDCDNTLLDSDLVLERLRPRLADILGPDRAARFWQVYEQVRAETERVSFPETVERLAAEFRDGDRLAEVSELLYAFPFRECVYPRSIDVIRYVASFATPVIVSDGDQLFQPHKIRASGLAAAVAGNVLIYSHKERHVPEIRCRFPARHYAVVDDKPHVLAAMKAALGPAATTVMVCQGKYARARRDGTPAPDLAVASVDRLLEIAPDRFAGRA